MASHLHRPMRNRNNATAATVAFLVLLLILLSVALLSPTAGAPATYMFSTAPESSSSSSSSSSSGSCEADLRSLPDAAARCSYLSSPSHPPCAPQGYVDYLRLYYCAFLSVSVSVSVSGGLAAAGAVAAALCWLLLLFYLLGDTASRYFCASLHGLSADLRLPPAVAGVTLLSLGNGAPDVLSSLVAFSSSAGGSEDDDDAGDVGLSSVLGGALFVSTVVAGVVAIVAGGRGPVVKIERGGFVRDVGFLLAALGFLVAVLLAGSVTVWVAAAFLSLYAAYVLLVVSTSHCCSTATISGDDDDDPEHDGGNAKTTTTKHAVAGGLDLDDLAAPLLLSADAGAISGDGDEEAPPPPVLLPKHTADSTATAAAVEHRRSKTKKKSLAHRVLDALQWPLSLPRRLTIPDIAAHRWSKPYAVASAFLAPPLLLATTIWSPANSTVILAGGALTGAILAALAYLGTASPAPPTSRWGRLPWLCGGFAMSVLWSYVAARELVALLAAAGLAAGVRRSVLGATVLAWGNSLGDLVADVAMAATRHAGGPGGPQTAVAGCYAGPAFNTVVGLGLSLTLAAGARFPRAYVVPVDESAYQAAGFLAAGLLWAIVVLPARGMRLDRVLGVGLLVIYLGFLGVRLGSLSLGTAIGS